MKQTEALPISTRYKQAQVFGTNEPTEVLDEDIISCLKYDPTGKYLCLGDNAGRIIIFNTIQKEKNEKCDEFYDYFAEFQSHAREFDPLKGSESSEEIIDISWLRPQGKYLKLLTTNSKSIKLWKAHEKIDKKVVKSATKELNFPKLQKEEAIFTANEQLIFPSVHSTDINSISHSNNEEYILSTDEEQSFLWSLEKPIRPYIANSISDKKRTSTSELNITCSKMHPTSDSIFVYGMNRSELGLCDIRLSSSVGNVIDFGLQTKSMKNFFSDMVASVGGIDFTNNGRYIISREYMNVKVWDIASTKTPVQNICIQESLKSKLVNLFENDCIFDKFSIAGSYDNNTILTGNYNNNFHLLNISTGLNTQYELNFKKNTISRQILAGKCPPITKLDTRRKTSIVAYHPLKHEIAVASLNCFFVYSV